ncbi:histidine kinase [Oscillospiraceae bacterium HV4-5-C5C]|nr:histidine kinase [Oscillospiraceae bacterium HV4-5-C5C]
MMNTNYYKVLWEQYHSVAEQSYAAEIANFNLRLRDIEKVTAYFSSNAILLDYADTPNTSIADSVYEYLKYFDGVFQNARSSNQYVTAMTFFTKAQHPFQMTGILENLTATSVPTEVLNSIKGSWVVAVSDQKLSMTYYQPVYTTSYREFIGVLKIAVDPAVVMDCFTEPAVYFYADDQSVYFKYADQSTQIIEPGQLPQATDTSRFSYLSSHESELLDGTFVTQVTMQEDFMHAVLMVLLPSLLMLMVLPLFYQKLMHKQMKRVVGLSDYIGQINSLNPAPYFEKTETDDEIGALIKAFNNNTRDINRLMREVAQAELQRKDSEFYALQAQIKPHFLYNTLENIRMTAEQEHDSRTSAMLEILGSYMRYGLKKDLKYTYLTSELQYIKYYQQLLDIRFPGQVTLSINVYLDISEVTCPYLILQPIVENAIKHGKTADESIHIWVDIRAAGVFRSQPDLEIRMKNNGYRIDTEQLQQLQKQFDEGISDEDGHVGLNNINYRLISCYGKDYHMQINSGEKRGCTFTIYLPIQNGGQP